MITRNTLSAWTKTAWCIHRSLWLNHAPTLCGRSSVCGCIAPSAAGPTLESSGRSLTSPVAKPIKPHISSFCPLKLLLIPFSSSLFSQVCYFPLDSVSSSLKSFCCLGSVLFRVFCLPLQGTKTMWQSTLLPTLASINLRANTACTHWRLTGRCSFSHPQFSVFPKSHWITMCNSLIPRTCHHQLISWMQRKHCRKSCAWLHKTT